ncbi:alpha-amylase family protein [Paenibacillus caseinilyticus]|nr:agarase [Paenibacillus caseinilyticus]MCZ8523905.1 agarase [Paenibacillus caseinilyticus]
MPFKLPAVGFTAGVVTLAAIAVAAGLLTSPPGLPGGGAPGAAVSDDDGKKDPGAKEQTGPIHVDRFGQVAGVTFSGKVAGEASLKGDTQPDDAYYGSLKAPGWDAYGGLKGSSETYGLKATGYYHIEALQNRKVMVTPAGTLYFSLGVNGLTANDTYTQLKGQEDRFEWMPPYEGEYRSAFLNSKDTFSFYVANRIRKTGQPYSSREFYEESISRIRKWGFNSAGGWSPANYAQEFKVPHFPFLPLSEIPEAQVDGLKIFDIFAEGAEAKIDALFAKNLPQNKDNPYIVGYFLGNESDYHLIINELPKLKGSQAPSKRKLVELLKSRYGSIDRFNTAWKTEYNGFDALYEASLPLSSTQARSDMDDFMKLYLDTYYGTVERVFRKYDPNHLLLGDRWLTTPSNHPKIRGMLAEAAGKYMDVISINHYARQLDREMLRDVYDKSGGRPILLTEFGYGTREQGLTAPLLASDEEQRAQLYRSYVEEAASLGYVVGTHWFSYLDQPATGRWFEGPSGESYNFGLLNVTDRPYKTFLSGVMETHKNIYSILLGKQAPYEAPFLAAEAKGK